MMKQIFSPATVFFLSLALFFSNKVVAFEATPSTSSPITASAYCDFLNEKAVADTGPLYAEAMGSDPDAACILRFGQPGHFSYEVIAGRENVPVSYVNALQQKAYCEWSGAQMKGNQNNDLSLRSNELFFNVTENSANTSLSTSGNGSSNGSSWNWEDTGLLIAGAATVAFFAPTLRERFAPEHWQKPKALYEEDTFTRDDTDARSTYVNSLQPSATSFEKGLRSQVSSPYKGSSLPVAANLAAREKLLPETKEQREAIDKRLAFLKDDEQHEKDNIHRQFLNILFEKEKGNMATVNLLGEQLEKHIQRLEASKRREELRCNTAAIDHRAAYYALERDLLASNDLLGATPLARLRYAWEQVSLNPFSNLTDQYNVTPNLKRVLAFAMFGGVTANLFMHSTISSLWFWCSTGAILYKLAVLAGAFA